jgi:hypothetical protein
MKNFKLSEHHILSDILLTNIPDNYIFNGSIQELVTMNNGISQMYLLIVDNNNKSNNEVKYLTKIASKSIKSLRENNKDFKTTNIFYFKYNEDICKFSILENVNNIIKYELKLKIDFNYK